jgi:hypothetical protein
MTEKKAFLLRLDKAVWAALDRLARAELRSVNAQIPDRCTRPRLAASAPQAPKTPHNPPADAAVMRLRQAIRDVPLDVQHETGRPA